MQDIEPKNKKNRRNFFLLLYVGTIALFFAYLLFFSDHNLSTHRYLNRKIANLEERITSTKNQIGNAYTFEQLKSDSVLLEKYARENLNMHRENEDVFILVYE